MMTPALRLLAALGCAALVPLAHAGGIDQLRSFLKDTRQGEGRFEQVVHAASGGTTERSQGQFTFARPDRFRWHYDQPYEQLLVSDGKTFWSWDPELKQATRQKTGDGLSATPAAILAGEKDLEANFTLENLPDADGLQWVRARPRNPDNSFAEVTLGLRGNAVERMTILDNFGQRTELRLLDVRTNRPLPPDAFRFTPPKDADIIDNPAPRG